MGRHSVDKRKKLHPDRPRRSRPPTTASGDDTLSSETTPHLTSPTLLSGASPSPPLNPAPTRALHPPLTAATPLPTAPTAPLTTATTPPLTAATPPHNPAHDDPPGSLVNASYSRSAHSPQPGYD